MTRARGLAFVAVVLILIASAAVRFYRLDQPKGYIFDEVYYAKDAKAIVDDRLGPKEGFQWMPGDEVSWPHPYYGKLAIAVGILLFGDDEMGWRFMPALAGLATLLLVFPLARRLGLRREWALLALLLAAVDLLGIAQSRIATLDVFLGLWSVLAIYLTLRYVQSGGRLVWLALAGVSGGLAFGTKWSGALACLASLVLIFVMWRGFRPAGATATPAANPASKAVQTAAAESGAGAAPAKMDGPQQRSGAAGDDAPTPETESRRPERKAAGGAGGQPLATRSRVAAVLLPLVFLILLPVALYAASYGFYFAAGHGLADWWQLHREMWTFSMNLDATHTYASQAPTWIIDVRPVWYHFKEYAAHYYGVVAMGHPLVWWAATLALVTLPLVAILDRRRELALPALIVALLYFPWFAASRTSFLYYMTPVAPFLAILVAVALARLAGQPPDLDDTSARTGVRTAAPETPDARRRAAKASGGGRTRLYGLGAFLAAAVVTALFWWQIGRAVAFVFYDLPARAAPVVGIAVASVLGALAVVAAAYVATRPRFLPAWRYLAWAFAGVALGVAVAFAPIVLDLPVSPDEFYRLMWLPSWI